MPQDPLAASVGRDDEKEEKAQICFHWGQEQSSLGCRQWWDQGVTKATVLGIRHRHDTILPSQKVQSWFPSSHPHPISPHDIQPCYLSNQSPLSLPTHTLPGNPNWHCLSSFLPSLPRSMQSHEPSAFTPMVILQFLHHKPSVSSRET